MSNPRLLSDPGLISQTAPWNMTPDEVYDYAYCVKNALQMLQSDPKVRPEDRKLILSFYRHIKAKKGKPKIRMGESFKTDKAINLVGFGNLEVKDAETFVSRLTTDWEAHASHPLFFTRCGLSLSPMTAGARKKIRENGGVYHVWMAG